MFLSISSLINVNRVIVRLQIPYSHSYFARLLRKVYFMTKIMPCRHDAVMGKILPNIVTISQYRAFILFNKATRLISSWRRRDIRIFIIVPGKLSLTAHGGKQHLLASKQKSTSEGILSLMNVKYEHYII